MPGAPTNLGRSCGFNRPMKPALEIIPTAVLVVIDLQRGFDDPAWGPTTNPSCVSNCVTLVRTWMTTGRPVVLVRHDSPKPESPLHPAAPGNAIVPELADVSADLLVTKSVNSAFYGAPDLHAWLQNRGLSQLVLVGIQTNMCVETTARMGGNLGYDVIVPLDATRTFDLAAPVGIDGAEVHATAEQLMTATAVSLHGGGFATVTDTRHVVAAALA